MLAQRLGSRRLVRHLDGEQGGDLRSRGAEPGHRGDQLGTRCRRGGGGDQRAHGEKAAASSTAIHRSGGSSAVNAATVAVPSLPPRRRERHAGLRRHRRQAQRPDHPADVDRGLDVAEPQVELLLLLDGERRLQLGGETRGGLVADDEGIVRRGHDAAQVAQVEVGELALGGLGAIDANRRRELGQQVLGHLQHGRLGHLRLAGRLRPGVVLAESLAYRGHALQGQLGDRPLLLGKRREHLGEVLLAGTQRFGLGRWGSSGGGVKCGRCGVAGAA